MTGFILTWLTVVTVWLTCLKDETNKLNDDVKPLRDEYKSDCFGQFREAGIVTMSRETKARVLSLEKYLKIKFVKERISTVEAHHEEDKVKV